MGASPTWQETSTSTAPATEETPAKPTAKKATEMSGCPSESRYQASQLSATVKGPTGWSFQELQLVDVSDAMKVYFHCSQNWANLCDKTATLMVLRFHYRGHKTNIRISERDHHCFRQAIIWANVVLWLIGPSNRFYIIISLLGTVLNWQRFVNLTFSQMIFANIHTIWGFLS